jgi:hypothetical protein
MSALEVLNEILDAGGRLEPVPNKRPTLLAPKSMHSFVEKHWTDLREFLDAHGSCSVDTFRRAQSFRRQVDDWTAAGRWAVPVLVLPGSPVAKIGHCVSCGCSIGVGWRCSPCLDAVHVALGLADQPEPLPPPTRTCARHPVTPRADCDTCRGGTLALKRVERQR